MTYIEFFDKVSSRNICACLSFAPERVVLIGHKAKLMEKHKQRYERLFSDRDHSIEFTYKTVSQSNLDNAVSVISQLVEEYEDCVFDITGGGEILLLALGMVCSQYSDKNIQIHRININNNTIADCDKDGVTIFCDAPQLSVEENIRIYGGDIVFGSVEEENTYKWDMNPEFLDDIELIWDKCKDNFRYWNTQIGVFEAMEAVGQKSEDGLTTTAKKGALNHYLTQHKAKYVKAAGIISYLKKNGLITYFDDSDEAVVTVSYKNAQVKRCLTKAGQALEVKVFAAAKNALNKEGMPLYNDVLNGVVIDWDGEFHDETQENEFDTENEIDVLLMHGMVPIFVSCKNGGFGSDELYKLATVAERFGGPYAKKVLIATCLDTMGDAGEYIRQRAKDMGIKIIDKIIEPEFTRNIKNLWNN